MARCRRGRPTTDAPAAASCRARSTPPGSFQGGRRALSRLPPPSGRRLPGTAGSRLARSVGSCSNANVRAPRDGLWVDGGGRVPRPVTFQVPDVIVTGRCWLEVGWVREDLLEPAVGQGMSGTARAMIEVVGPTAPPAVDQEKPRSSSPPMRLMVVRSVAPWSAGCGAVHPCWRPLRRWSFENPSDGGGLRHSSRVGLVGKATGYQLGRAGSGTNLARPASRCSLFHLTSRPASTASLSATKRSLLPWSTLRLEILPSGRPRPRSGVASCEEAFASTTLADLQRGRTGQAPHQRDYRARRRCRTRTPQAAETRRQAA